MAKEGEYILSPLARALREMHIRKMNEEHSQTERIIVDGEHVINVLNNYGRLKAKQ